MVPKQKGKKRDFMSVHISLLSLVLYLLTVVITYWDNTLTSEGK